jgi:hypothetical protein
MVRNSFRQRLRAKKGLKMALPVQLVNNKGREPVLAPGVRLRF